MASCCNLTPVFFQKCGGMLQPHSRLYAAPTASHTLRTQILGSICITLCPNQHTLTAASRLIRVASPQGQLRNARFCTGLVTSW